MWKSIANLDFLMTQLGNFSKKRDILKKICVLNKQSGWKIDPVPFLVILGCDYEAASVSK